MHEAVMAGENADGGVFFPRLPKEQEIAFPHVTHRDRQAVLLQWRVGGQTIYRLTRHVVLFSYLEETD